MSDTPITDALLDDMGEGWPDRWAEMLKQFERELADARAELAEAKAKITMLKGEARYGVDLFQRAINAERELAEAKDDLNDRRKFSYAVALALEGFKGDYIEIIKELVAAKKNAEPFGYFQYATHLDAWVQNRDSNKGVAFYTTPQPQQEKQPYAFEASMYSKGGMKIDPVTGNVSIGTPQPQREWVGLTEQQIIDLFHEAGDDPFDFTCAIEAKLREKNT